MSLRICHVVTRLDRGGSAENTVLTALHQARSGHTVLLVAGPSDESRMGADERASVAERLADLRRAGGAALTCPTLGREISPLHDARALASLTATLCRWRPDVVHTHTSKAGILGRLAAQLTGVPWVIHTYHGHVYSGYSGRLRSWLFATLERLCAPLADRLIALTDREREDHLAAGVGTPGQFHVVPSGVDLAPFATARDGAEMRHVLGLPRNAFLVGSVGRLTAVKGHRTLVEALPRLPPEVHVALLGDGELRDELAAVARGQGTAERLHFLGWRPDVPACLAAFDLFAMPSLNEGMGRAAVEAMAAGLPVVGSRVYGLENVVAQGETGLLVPAADPAALAQAIALLVGSPETRARLAQAAPVRARQFSLEAMLSALDELLAEARGTPASARAPAAPGEAAR